MKSLILLALISVPSFAADGGCRVMVQSQVLPYGETFPFDPLSEEIVGSQGHKITRNEADADLKVFFTHEYKYADVIPGFGVRYDKTLRVQIHDQNGFRIYSKGIDGSNSDLNKRDLLEVLNGFDCDVDCSAVSEADANSLLANYCASKSRLKISL